MPFSARVVVSAGALALGGCIGAGSEGLSDPEGASDSEEQVQPRAIEGEHNILKNSDFEEGSAAPWASSSSGKARATARVENGAYCMLLHEAGDTAWDAQIRQRQLRLRQGHHYRVEFTAFADRPTQVRPKVGSVGPTYDEYWASVIDVDTSPQRYSGYFVMQHPDDLEGELAFQLAGPLAAGDGPVKVCFDDIELSDPDFTPVASADNSPKVRVNQVGYFPRLGKRATYRAKTREPLGWELLAADGNVVASGQTLVYGDDRASGELVHQVDFSAYSEPGKGYRVRITGSGEPEEKVTSYPFDIDAGIYGALKSDAVHFFYHQRSGTPIEMPLAREQRWTRGAGHAGENDGQVQCLPELECGFTMDVRGGWYDAGDHGKYVVNGGITVWTLFNLYERSVHLSSQKPPFGDGSLPIPEAGNGVNDLLDEVRWQMDFMMRMQIDEDAPKWPGMVFHKVHEQKWSPLPLSPADASVQRFLHRPSTAATLNLAATAAQCARIFRSIDPEYSRRCLQASERAWEAAQRFPDLVAPGSDNVGGGPYDDLTVRDEYYWAAVELYLATGKASYADFVRRSQDFLDVPAGAQSALNWQMVHVLGTISIATVPGFDGETVQQARAALLKAADAYASSVAREGYRTPLPSTGGNTYPWGSNSFVVNNMMILGLAYDFTHAAKYRQAMVDGMDYLLGRNPNSQSYVTGYGEVPLKNPHHRFWAHQIAPETPEPPPGILSGGPNSALQDPYAQAQGLPGCAPMKCFVDHIESWSTNEIAINWNAPFAWAVTVLDEIAE